MNVSVVMPAYNVEKYIGQALDSLLAQTYTDWECVIVDDCSTDRTADIVKEYAARDGRIKYHKLEKNSGSAKVPRDTAITLAGGEWILYFDADDKIAPDMLQSQVGRQRETGADFVGIRAVRMDEDGVLLSEAMIPNDDFDMSQVLTSKESAMLTVGGWKISTAGSLARKELYSKRKMTSNHINADEYNAREILLNSDKVAFVDCPYYYTDNSASVTHIFSRKLFDVLITSHALTELIAEHFGEGSPEHGKAMTAFHYSLLYRHIVYADTRRKFNKEPLLCPGAAP